jgi:urease accessory protein
VLVNTAGGIAGGDRFSVDLDLGRGSRLTVTTATAEKVYRSLGAVARLDVAARLEENAELIWLPHETILFDHARFERRVDIALAPTAKLAFAEAVIFGRAAMGETVGQGRFLEHWRIRRGGRLIFAENFSLDGAVARMLRQAAIAGPNVALGTLLLVPGDDAMVAAARAAAVACRGEIGISTWNGFALARLAAADGAALRHDLLLMLRAFGRSALPRLWLN